MLRKRWKGNEILDNNSSLKNKRKQQAYKKCKSDTGNWTESNSTIHKSYVTLIDL